MDADNNMQVGDIILLEGGWMYDKVKGIRFYMADNGELFDENHNLITGDEIQ